MDIFIDESGTHKHIGHATTAIVYLEVKSIVRFEDHLREIEQELKISSFHWAEERWFMRNKFVLEALKLDFSVKVAIFENPMHPERMFELVFQHLITETNIRNIFIDGKKPKWYEHRLKKTLRNKGLSVKKVKTVRREAKVGIQLADALAGLIRYHYDNPQKKDAIRLFNKLKKEGKLAAQLLFETEAVEKFLPKQ